MCGVGGKNSHSFLRLVLLDNITEQIRFKNFGEGRTDGLLDIQTDTKTGGMTDRQTDRPRDGQTETQTDRQTHTDGLSER